MFARELVPVLGPGTALAVLGSVNATATAAGTTLATATAITTVYTACTTGTEGQGFFLPASMNGGDQCQVANETTASICVYPPTTAAKINGATAGVPVKLAPNTVGIFTCKNGTDWIAAF